MIMEQRQAEYNLAKANTPFMKAVINFFVALIQAK
jgi:hypothetical protein